MGWHPWHLSKPRDPVVSLQSTGNPFSHFHASFPKYLHCFIGTEPDTAFGTAPTQSASCPRLKCKNSLLLPARIRSFLRLKAMQCIRTALISIHPGSHGLPSRVSIRAPCGSRSNYSPLRLRAMAAKVEYLTAADLEKVKGDKVAVVDVRDEERQSGGHIAGSLHYASETFENHVVDLLHDVQGKEAVVFHCAKSQVRGPTCAKAFADHLSRAKEAGTAPNIPRVLVLEHGFNGWAGAGRKVCNCKDNPCKCK